MIHSNSNSKLSTRATPCLITIWLMSSKLSILHINCELGPTSRLKKVIPNMSLFCLSTLATSVNENDGPSVKEQIINYNNSYVIYNAAEKFDKDVNKVFGYNLNHNYWEN